MAHSFMALAVWSATFRLMGVPFLHGLQNPIVGLVRQVRAHDMKVEHVLPKVFGDLVGWPRGVVGHAVQHFVKGLLAVEAHGLG